MNVIVLVNDTFRRGHVGCYGKYVDSDSKPGLIRPTVSYL